MNLDVLYHDNHLLAVNKPSGLLTQPSGTEKDNLEDRSKAWIKEVKNKPGNVFLHAVHRLDQVVSGIVLFACTDKALSRLNAGLRTHRFKKIYHAVVSGMPPQKEGSLRHFLIHNDYVAGVAEEGDPDAKECLLDYAVLKQSEARTLLEIQLHTGRYHQIRAQLAAIGCPVAGDEKYGSADKLPGGAIALHHARLTVIHPVSKNEIVIEAPYPAHWPAV
ncbi:MAG: RNA pseudouridine synthase [Pontiellaceae bacterium]|jgi:23S rRNA pseudouridine1911/1915/1917 synthase|nr:RNA pseudouridine synthase [Pontiellaceae bacterium]